MKELILGGARSGKSAYAEEQALAHCSTESPIYVATAGVSSDKEMLKRIEKHQLQRASSWQLIEEPLDLASILMTYSSQKHCLLIDCLTLWLTNALINDCWEEKKSQFLNAIDHSSASIYCVSNEVGSGIVPLGELSRRFVDESGSLHQALAKKCNKVTLVVAGLPLSLKE